MTKGLLKGVDSKPLKISEAISTSSNNKKPIHFVRKNVVEEGLIEENYHELLKKESF